MNPNPTQPAFKSHARKDIIILLAFLVFIVTLTCFTYFVNAFENVVADHIHLPIIELIFILVMVAVMVLFYCSRRIREINFFISKIRESDILQKKLNERLEIVLKSSSAVLFNVKVNSDFDLLYASENYQTVLGYSPEEYYTRNFWANHIHPEDKAGVFSLFPELFENGFLSMQFRFQHKDGSWKDMQSEMKCIYDAGGKPDELVGNWWDITKLKQRDRILHEANERFELATKATNDTIYDWNLVSNELWMSEGMARTFGYDKDLKFDIPLWESKIHPEDHDATLNSITESLANKDKVWTGSYRFKKSDGSYAHVFDRGLVVYDQNNNPQKWIGTMSDVTLLKETENELKKSIVIAEDSARAKGDFLANMSHEIRTPLNGIIGMTEMALDTELNDQQRRYMDTVKSSSETLLCLINDILDFSKIDAGKLDLCPYQFSLRDEIPRTLQPLALKASLKNLELIFRIAPGVPDLHLLDGLRLQQIIINLVGNAIKFTQTGEITLGIELHNVKGNQAELLFSISDTGIGIAQDKLNSVFQEFSQADNSTTKTYGGTGLGLTISKRLVEMMGGRVGVDSELGKGSIFKFTVTTQLLPAQKVSSFESNTALEGMKVLIAEDNQSSRDYIVETMKHFKLIPTAVSNGADALKELKNAIDQTPYSLLLLDIHMPGALDGFDLASKIKEDETLNSTEIIIISMSQKASDREYFRQLGINEFFSKPFSQSDLFDSIQNAIGAKKQLESLPMKKNMLTSHHFSSDKYSILLVEDNLVNQEVATAFLTKKGHKVSIAGNGLEAVQMIKGGTFDLVFMDIQMPKMNGYEATSEIRRYESQTGQHVPIIGLTANAMKGDKEKCLDAGMDDYITKPLRIDEMIKAIDRQMNPVRIDSVSPHITSTITAIDFTTLLEKLDGDTDLLETIIDKFLTHAPDLLLALREAITHLKFAEIATCAHSFRGMCLNFDLAKIAEYTFEIEKHALKESPEAFGVLMNKTESEMQQIIKYFTDWKMARYKKAV